MARKKILWLCSWYPSEVDKFNGDFIQRHALAAALYNDIYVIYIAGDEKGLINETKEAIIHQEGLTEHLVYFRKQSSLTGKVISQYRWLYLFKKAIKQYFTRNGKPDLVHVHVPVKAGIPALWIKRKYDVPYIVTEHWGIYNAVEQLNYSRRSRVFKKYTKAIFRGSLTFISVSKYLAEGVNRQVIKKEYEIIPNVVDTNLFYYSGRRPVNEFRFIHVSNMVPLKNAEGILRAFKSLLEKRNDVELVMVGNANNTISDYSLALGLPGNKVFFRGEVPYKEVAAEMLESDCLLVFSNIENSPCVIGEALCCGLPVIATNAGGIPELINQGNSVMVEPKDEAGLMAAMQEVIKRYEKYNRKKIAEDAQGKFSYDVVGKKLSEIYSQVI